MFGVLLLDKSLDPGLYFLEQFNMARFQRRDVLQGETERRQREVVVEGLPGGEHFFYEFS